MALRDWHQQENILLSARPRAATVHCDRDGIQLQCTVTVTVRPAWTYFRDADSVGRGDKEMTLAREAVGSPLRLPVHEPVLPD